MRRGNATKKSMRGQIAAMNQGGETAKRVTLYGADGMKAREGATREAI